MFARFSRSHRVTPLIRRSFFTSPQRGALSSFQLNRSFSCVFDQLSCQQQRYYAKGYDSLLQDDLDSKRGSHDDFKLSKDEISNILHAFRNVTLNHNETNEKLQSLSRSNMDLISKWQYMVQILIMAKIAVISKHGLQDIEQFKRILHKAIKKSRDGSEILSIHQQNWDDWIKVVFPDLKTDWEEKPRVPKAKMIRIIEKLLDEISSEQFVKDVSPIINNPNRSVQQKGSDLLNEISNRHQKIMEKYGFVGEEGYIECQRSLVIHFFGDEDINKLSQNVSGVVFNFTSRLAPQIDEKQLS